MMKIKKGHVYHLLITVFMYCCYQWIIETVEEDVWTRSGCFLFVLLFNAVLGVGWTDRDGNFYEDLK